MGAGLQKSCEKVYGDSKNSLCEANKMTTCEIVKAPSPGPSPSPPTPHPTPTPPGPKPPAPTPPSPKPTPSPTPPSPSPGQPPIACQKCFLNHCPNLHKAASAACHTCVTTNQWTCASSCRPYPFAKVGPWFCDGSEVQLV